MARFERAPMPHDEEVATLGLVVQGMIAPGDIVEAEMLWGPHVQPEDQIKLSQIMAVAQSNREANLGGQTDLARKLIGEAFEGRDLAVKILGDAAHWGPREINDLGGKTS